MRARFGLLLGLAACGPVEHFVALPAGETTVLLHRPAASIAYEVEHFEASDSIRLQTSDQDVYALLYEASLDELGLGNDASPHCRLLHPDRALRLAVGEDRSEWTSLQRAPDEVFEAFVPGLLARCDPCPPLVATRQMATTNGRASAAARLDSDRLLIYARDSLYSIGAEGGFDTNLGCPHYLRSLAALGSNHFLGGGAVGIVELKIDEPENACEVVRTATLADLHPEDSRLPELDVLSLGASAGDPVYGLSDDGGLYEYRGGALVLLDRFELHPLDLARPTEEPNVTAVETERARLVRLGARELLISMGWDKIYHWRDGRTIRVDRIDIPEVIELNGSDRISAIADLGEAGVIAASTNADFFRRDPVSSLWSSWFTAPATDSIGAIAQFRNGIIATVQGGRLIRWHEETGLCPTPFEVTGAHDGDGALLLVREDEIIVVDFFGDNQRPTGVLRLSPER